MARSIDKGIRLPPYDNRRKTTEDFSKKQAALDKIKQNILPFPGSACYNGIRK